MLPKKQKSAAKKAAPAKPAATKAKTAAPKAPSRAAPAKVTPKKGLSIKQLVRSTPAYYKNKAEDDGVVIARYRPTAKTKGGLPAITALSYSTANAASRRNKYKVSCIGLEQGVPMHKQDRVIVSCECGDFCFTWEYANWTHNASYIKYSNGEPARMTNPGNRPGMCKHLCALAYEIMQNKD